MTNKHIPIIEGAGGGKGSKGRAAQEAPNTLQSRTSVRVLEVISEGETVGLVGGAKGIFFDDVPVQNDDDSYNFNNVTWAERVGLPSQDYIEGFPSAQAEYTVGINITTTNPASYTVTGTAIDAVRVTVVLPEGLSEQNTSNGDLNGSTVTVAIDTKAEPSGVWAEVAQHTITGKTTSPYEKAYRVDRPAGSGLWSVRIRRVTADAATAAIRNATTFARATEIQDVKLEYENTAYVGIAVDAESVGNKIPRRSYKYRGIKCKVPLNYDPETATYSGAWNGQFKVAWTDNPAWHLYDLLTNTRYGMGDFITEDQLDKFSFYDAAVYNDGLVPDGKGGTERRYTFNSVLAAQEDAVKTIQALAGSFRATLLKEGALYRVNQDRPSDTVRTITNSNVIDGRFNYASTPIQNRHTVCHVTYNDKQDRYLRSIATVEAASGFITRYGYNVTEVAAYGATTEGQAIRHGKWLLDTELSQLDVAIWKSSFAQMDLRVGDVVTIDDDAYPSTRLFRVMRITLASEPNIVEVEALQYDPTKYSRIETGISVNPPTGGGVDAGGYIPDPTGVTFRVSSFVTDEGIKRDLNISWTPPYSTILSHYSINWKRDNGNYTETNNILNPSYVIENISEGTYYVVIKSHSRLGTVSPGVAVAYLFSLEGGSGSFLNAPINLQIQNGAGNTFSGQAIAFEWENPATNSTVVDSVLKDFVITFRDPSTDNLLRTAYAPPVPVGSKQTFLYSFEQNLQDGGPRRSVKITVACRDTDNLLSAGLTTTFTNPSPTAPTLTVNPGVSSMLVQTSVPLDQDYAGTIVWMSTIAGFTPSEANKVYQGPDTSTMLVDITETVYFKAAHYDLFGTTGLNISTEQSATPSFPGGIYHTSTFPANPAAIGGEEVFFYTSGDPATQGLYGWDGTQWLYTRDGANLIVNSVTADKISVVNLGAISANLGSITSGNITVDQAGYIRAGATGLTTGNGFWLGYSSGSYKWRVGNPTGARAEWTGTAFNIYNSSNQLTLSSGAVDYSLISGKPTSLNNINSTEYAALNSISVLANDFNSQNNRNSTTPTAPTVATDGTAVDHVINNDASASISFEWGYSGNEGDIDGFFVYFRQDDTSISTVVDGIYKANESIFVVPASKRAHFFHGVDPTKFYNFGVRAFRSVDKDINADGVLVSSLAYPSTTPGERPYRPSTSVAWTGNVTGTINGTTASSITDQLSDIANDGKLTPGEKQALRAEWGDIINTHYQLYTSMIEMGLTSDAAAFRTHLNTLGTYLNNGTSWTAGGGLPNTWTIPSWISDANLSVTTNITAATFRNTFATYYNNVEGWRRVYNRHNINSYNKLSSTNISTYIQSLAVDTLYIANNAVTVPTVVESSDYSSGFPTSGYSVLRYVPNTDDPNASGNVNYDTASNATGYQLFSELTTNLTMASPGNVLIDLNIQFRPLSGGWDGLYARIHRFSGTTDQGQIGFGVATNVAAAESTLSCKFVNTISSSGTYTYKVYLSSRYGNGNVKIRKGVMTLLGVKK